MRDQFHGPTLSHEPERHHREGHTRGIRSTGSSDARGWTARDAAVQAALALAAAGAYFGIRVVVEGDRDTAVRNAERLLDLERALGIDIELGVQDRIVDQSVLRAIGNFSYVWFHWPLLIVFSCLVFVLSRARFRHLLHALIISGVIGLVFFAVFPVAPPRFMPGYEGTVSDAARRHYLDYPLSWTNQVASFPSFHVGWTLITCIALASVVAASTPARTRAAQVVALTPAVLVGIAVVTTGNHYVVDTIAGTAIATGAYLAIDPRWRHQPRQPDEAPPQITADTIERS
jgi:membrane-associated phospholipid phosphatase